MDIEPAAPTAADPAGEGLHEPLPASWRRRLRRAVVEHAGTPRRSQRPVLHVGDPGGAVHRFQVDGSEPSDLGLRTDLVAALLAGAGRTGGPPPMVWLSRSGDLEVQDVDCAWLAAARAAAQEAAAPLAMVIVTRHGWRDPRSGLSRTWVRMRHRADNRG